MSVSCGGGSCGRVVDELWTSCGGVVGVLVDVFGGWVECLGEIW